MASVLENNSVRRTKHLNRCLSVLLNRSGFYWGNMAGLPVTLTRSLVLVRRKNIRICLPEVGEQKAMFVPLGDALPQQGTCLFAPVSDGIGHNLSGSSALSQPDPAFVFTALHKRPEFIKFQHVTLLDLEQRLSQHWEPLDFF